MGGKKIRGRLCPSINTCAKANNKYMKDCDKTEESSYLKYLDVTNLYGREMSQKLPVNGFKWVEDLSEFNEDFINIYNEKSNGGYFLQVDVEYPESLHERHDDLPFLPEKKRVDKVKKTCS